jgi:thiamine pyrophosphokinase
MKHAVILANGAFPSHPLALAVLKQTTWLVCCDGAAASLLAAGMEPQHIVGDLDSLPPALHVRFQDRITYDPDQETNDLTKAVRLCINQGATAATILGATGIREDHTMANLALLARYARELEIRMITDHGVFHVIRHQGALSSWPGQQISIFNLTPGIPVTASGLKYPVQALPMQELWQGSLNEALDREISIIAPEATLLVFCGHPPVETIEKGYEDADTRRY